MSLRSWLDDAHVSESELAALLSGKPNKETSKREPATLWLPCVLGTATITPPRTWAYQIEAVMIYASRVPVGDLIVDVDVTQEIPEFGPGSAISSFKYYDIVTAAEGGDVYFNLVPERNSYYRKASTGRVSLTVPFPARVLYGTQTMTLAFSGATSVEGLMLYRRVEMD